MTSPAWIALLYAVPARDDLRQDKADEEEGVKPHAAGLRERHLAYNAINSVPMVAARTDAT